MNISKLIPELDIDLEIKNLMLDSRQQLENSVFFCIEGLTHDSHDFVNQAIDNGAVAIVHTKELPIYQEGVVYHKVQEIYDELHRMANLFYDYPSSSMFVYGITGTNGKTTIMKTVQEVLKKFHVQAGYIGTISVEYRDKKLQPSLTTPDIVHTNKILDQMRQEGVEELCLEVSSQGLSLHRVDGISFDLLNFTNLSHDHLDYHKDMESYFEAKEVLFEQIAPDKPIIINLDDPYGKRLYQKHADRAITYGIETPADYHAQNINIHSDYTEFTLVHAGIQYPVFTKMLAYFNVLNILAVIANLHYRGYALEAIISHIADIEPIEGRLISIDEGQDFSVFVDFGHAPESMKNVYEFVQSRLSSKGRMITVFGAAGERDHSKRPLMGKVASQYNDLVILTEHDNRSEVVEQINQDIIRGFIHPNYLYIPKRFSAIEYALKTAKKNDIVVLIGKGQERFIYRDFGKEAWMGDDEAARRILKNLVKENSNE